MSAKNKKMFVNETKRHEMEFLSKKIIFLAEFLNPHEYESNTFVLR
jgi:hypothetical protein